jgi:hypothetical protein
MMRLSYEDTMAASRRLDELLKPEGKEMPEIGGKKLAGEFGQMLSDLRKQMDEMKLSLAAAVTELTEEVKAGKQVEQAIRQEAAVVRETFGGVLGNAKSGENG